MSLPRGMCVVRDPVTARAVRDRIVIEGPALARGAPVVEAILRLAQEQQYGLRSVRIDREKVVIHRYLPSFERLGESIEEATRHQREERLEALNAFTQAVCTAMGIDAPVYIYRGWRIVASWPKPAEATTNGEAS